MKKVENTLQQLQVDYTSYARITEESFGSEVYLVNTKKDQKILKLAHSKDKFWRELKSLDFLNGLISVPAVQKSLNPDADFNGAILMDRLSGHPLNLTTLDLSTAKACGQLLAKLHLIPTEGLGYFQKDGFEKIPFENWWSYRRDLVFGAWTRPIQNRIDPQTLERFHQTFKSYFNNFENSPNCFIHCDFRFGNIMADKGEVVGLIDFESLRTGDPAYDFIKIHEAIGQQSDLWDVFLKGYSELKSLPDLKNTIPYYELDLNFGFLRWALSRGDEKLFQERLTKLLMLIEAHGN